MLSAKISQSLALIWARHCTANLFFLNANVIFMRLMTVRKRLYYSRSYLMRPATVNHYATKKFNH